MATSLFYFLKFSVVDDDIIPRTIPIITTNSGISKKLEIFGISRGLICTTGCKIDGVSFSRSRRMRSQSIVTHMRKCYLLALFLSDRSTSTADILRNLQTLTVNNGCAEFLQTVDIFVKKLVSLSRILSCCFFRIKPY